MELEVGGGEAGCWAVGVVVVVAGIRGCGCGGGMDAC